MTAMESKIVKFIDWWFGETWKISNALAVFYSYAILVRTLLVYYFNMQDIDYMIMDGIVFSALLLPTMVGPDIKNELTNTKENK